MAVFTDASEKEVDSACVLYGLFVCGAFGYEVLHGAVEDVDVAGGNVYM